MTLTSDTSSKEFYFIVDYNKNIFKIKKSFLHTNFDQSYYLVSKNHLSQYCKH